MSKIIKSKRVGNPDSKYTYNPEQFDKDVKDKNVKIEQLKASLKQLLEESITNRPEYIDGSKMSVEQACSCVREVCYDLFVKYNFIEDKRGT